MKMMKKIMAVIVAAAVSVTAMIATGVTASAKGVFDDAITMKALTYYSEDLESSDTIYYKLKFSSNGKLNLFCEDTEDHSWAATMRWYLIDSSTNELSSGYLSDNLKAEIKDIKKGTYYLKIVAKGDISFTNLYYNFISDGKTTVVEEPPVTIAIKMEVGDSLKVSTVKNDYDGKVTWKTTKKSVAIVSKGKIIAKSEGKARIRAYLEDGSYVEIMVIVEE